MPFSYPEKIKERVLYLYDKGIPTKALEEKFDVSASTIRRWARLEGIVKGRGEGFKISYIYFKSDEDFDARATNLYETGLSLSMVSEVLDSSNSRVESALRRMGVEPRTLSEAKANQTHNPANPYARRRMEKIVRVSRLKAEGYSNKKIREVTGLSIPTIKTYLKSKYNPYTK